MGAYTNGFERDRILNALLPRLGWKGENLNDTSAGSTSGRYFNDGSFHPIVTIANVQACAETPGLTGESLDTYLLDKEKAVILQGLTSVFNSPELTDNTKLFERNLNNDTLIPGGENFTGIRFKLPSKGYALQVKTLLLYFSLDTDITLYLYKDGKTEPVWQKTVNVTGGEINEAEPLSDGETQNELIMNSGIYYLGYYQDEITGQAYDESSCRWQPSKVFGYEYFQAKRSGADFDRKNIGITNATFGINAEVIAFKNHTDHIIRNAAMFDNLIGLQMAYNISKMMLHTNRSNGDERKQKDALVQFEADGAVPIADVVKVPGLKGKIEAEVKRLKETFFPKPKAQVVSIC